MSVTIDRKVNDFAREYHIEGLTSPSLVAILEHQTGYTVDKARRFLGFQERIDRELRSHPIIHHNAYTAWFRQGHQRTDEIRAFIVQFSVFSNLFLVAQLWKTINADSVEGMRASKEILANEIGVVFRSPGQKSPTDTDERNACDTELVSSEGTVDGGTFRFRAALPLAFFTWHSRLEAQHALHTQEELEELYFTSRLDEDGFIHYGNEMLDGVAAFWNGLNTQRQLL